MSSILVNELPYGDFYKLTLRFKDKELERRYLQQTEPARLTQLRWAAFIIGLLYCLFAVIDQWALSGELSDLATRLHLSLGLSLSLFILITFRVRSARLLFSGVFIANIIAWFNHFVIVISGDVSMYFVEVYLMLLWVWVASGFPVTTAFKYNVFFLVLFELVMQQFASFSTEQMLVHRLFMFASILLGGYGGYLVEYYKRKSFINYELVSQANRTKDKFFSIISHDLRGPIGSMSVILNNVATCGADLDKNNIYSMLCRSTKNTYQLLENLLAWSHSQNGQLECKLKNFLLKASADHSMELFQSSASQKGINLHVDIPTDIYVYADFEMANTIIRNLINNAVKFTEPGGRIDVSASVDGNMAKIMVKDNGVGIPEDVRQNMFQLDKKVYSTVGTSSESGTGMGLSLCAEFVRRNGGNIEVHSKPGEGSQFIFTLLLGQFEEEQQQVAEQVRGWKVLVVEDNPLHETSSNQALQSMGFDVMIARNAKQAVDMTLEQQPDLVLMDFDLPDFNGDIATQQIEQQARPRPKAIIALTSYSKAELDKKLVQVKFDGYLHKPLNSTELLECLRPYV